MMQENSLEKGAVYPHGDKNTGQSKRLASYIVVQ